MRWHVRASAHAVRALLDSYGIEGVYVRICGAEPGCLSIGTDTRNLPR